MAGHGAHVLVFLFLHEPERKPALWTAAGKKEEIPVFFMYEQETTRYLKKKILKTKEMYGPAEIRTQDLRHVKATS